MAQATNKVKKQMRGLPKSSFSVTTVEPISSGMVVNLNASSGKAGISTSCTSVRLQNNRLNLTWLARTLALLSTTTKCFMLYMNHVNALDYAWIFRARNFVLSDNINLNVPMHIAFVDGRNEIKSLTHGEC
ncbi:hypothetical protein PIB30_047116 [Stylosanthes scabra]|uniref:Uncharacterized protein n=1 Tax=Stylosanthes scabra TaxID=79078 RepID=A0ABU6TGD2_9FABA|nr:hypothetical protein [Stylosanthes scabra]